MKQMVRFQVGDEKALQAHNQTGDLGKERIRGVWADRQCSDPTHDMENSSVDNTQFGGMGGSKLTAPAPPTPTEGPLDPDRLTLTDVSS